MSNQSYDEFWEEHLEEGKTKDLPSNVKLAVQAQVAAEHLTTDPNWDYFLSIIQGWLETTKISIDGMQETIFLPAVLSLEQVMSIKLNHAYNQGLKDALENVIEIPKSLKDNGELAQEMLKEFKPSYDA